MYHSSYTVPLRYFSLNYNHSSTKRTALEMAYWRKTFCFVFSAYFIFNYDTSHFFLYATTVKITTKPLVISDYFHKIPNQFVIENIEMTEQID